MVTKIIIKSVHAEGEIIVNGLVYNGVMPPIDLNEEDLKYVVEYIKNLNNE